MQIGVQTLRDRSRHGARTVRQAQTRQAVVQHALGDQLTGLAGADHQTGDTAEIAVDIARDLDRGRGDRDRALTDRRFRPDPLGRRIGGLEPPVEQGTDHVVFGGAAVAFLDLAQHLRLADDQAVEGGGYGEQLPQRIVPAFDVKRRFDRRAGARIQVGPHGRCGGIGIVMGDMQLDTIAGRQQHRLVDAG